eukprot:12895699-Prorocentrum_lima.AAC.1
MGSSSRLAHRCQARHSRSINGTLSGSKSLSSPSLRTHGIQPQENVALQFRRSLQVHREHVAQQIMPN